jgi:UDP-N-acetylmuramate-alanine ligase
MKLVSENCSVTAQPPPQTGSAAGQLRTLPLDLPAFLTREQHRIHLVGVAGSGMSGIAALLIELGHTVSGSDKVSTMETDRLQRLGLRFHEQHRPEDARPADLIVFSSAIRSDNPILGSARERESRSCAAPKRWPQSCAANAASSSLECMAKRRPQQ